MCHVGRKVFYTYLNMSKNTLQVLDELCVGSSAWPPCHAEVSGTSSQQNSNWRCSENKVFVPTHARSDHAAISALQCLPTSTNSSKYNMHTDINNGTSFQHTERKLLRAPCIAWVGDAIVWSSSVHISCISPFNWYQNQRPWMTSNGHYALCYTNHASFRAHNGNLKKDRLILSAPFSGKNVAQGLCFQTV